MSVLAVQAVTVVPTVAVVLMVDERQVWEGLLLQLVAPKLQMLRVLVLAVDEADGNKDPFPFFPHF